MRSSAPDILPKAPSHFDVRLLAPLRTATEQDHDVLAVLGKVDPIARPPIDPILADDADSLDGRRVAHLETRPGDCNLAAA